MRAITGSPCFSATTPARCTNTGAHEVLNSISLACNWAAVTLQVPEWHRVLSFVGPSLIGADKVHFLAAIKRHVPAEDYVMIGNDHSLRAYASPDDRRAADAAGWRFLSEGAFAAGVR